MKLFLTFFFLLHLTLHAQVTITLQPGGNSGKDAEVFSLEPTTNFNNDLIRANAWTFSGFFGVQRAFIDFDFSTIPADAKIESAYLSLYSPGNPNSQSQSGSNATYIKRVIENWGELNVTWNSQPAFTELNRVLLPSSSSDYQNYTDIDVTNLVEDMFADPDHSYGFMLQLQTENNPRRLAFASSDHVNVNLLPKLVITYTSPACTSLLLRPGAAGKDAEIFSREVNTNYNNDTYRGNAWTFSNQLGIVRGLLEFDLSSLPANAEVNAAYLSLYAPDLPHTQYHSGDNSAYLLRITESWNETSVTWANQPSTSNSNAVTLSNSDQSYQNYINIDVTDMVNDMLADPANSHGFMLLQQLEEPLRRISFASGDYPNPAKHPKLEICYTPSVDTKPVTENIKALQLVPNPANDFIQVNWNGDESSIRILVYDQMGKVVAKDVLTKAGYLEVSQLPASTYIVRAQNEQAVTIYQASLVKL